MEGSPERRPIEEVISGRANYGVARAELLLHRLHGKPLVALAAIFQHSAVILLAKKESGIENPHEMIGKRVMLLEGDDAAEYIAMFQNEGVSLEQIKAIPSTFNIDDLIDGKTDVFNAYITNEPYYLERKGITGSIISPKAYGIDFYGDCLFTSERELKEHPDQVKAFREASLRGWKYAMARSEEIIDVILTKYGVKKTRDHLSFEANAIRKLMLPDLVEIGHMNPGRWRHMADTYVGLGMADSDYSLKDFIYNPNPTPDYTWVRWVVGATVSIGLLVSLGFFVLLFFNRKLRVEVTQRRQVEEDLRESEKKYQDLYDNAPDMFISVDGKTATILKCNQTLAKILGFTKEEIIGRPVFDLYTPDSAEHAKSTVFPMFVKTGTIKEEEFQLQRKDGSTINVSLNVSAVKDEKGNILQSRSVLRDITKRKQAEEEREKLIKELQESLKEIKTLRGILPLCSFCKKIRDDKGYWEQVDVYIHKHSQADISHSLCPDCAKEHYPDLEIYDD